MSRRIFLEQAGRLAAGVVALGAGGLDLLAARPASAAAQRVFTAGRFALTLDQGPPIFLQSFEGGTARGEVVPEAGPAKGGGLQKKHIAALRFDPLLIRTGIGSPLKPLLDQIQALLAGGSPRLNGAVTVADFELKAQRRLEFSNAVISEVVFPALDAGSKEAAFLDVTLVPEHAKWADAKGETLPQDTKAALASKRSLLSNFELKIPGVDCSGVNRIEALAIRSPSVPDEIGVTREPIKALSRLELPNLVVTVSQAKATGFLDWHKKFLIEGNNADEQEKTGVDLLFLDAARKETLLALGFDHVGIIAAAPLPASAGADAVARMKAEMYCEAITLKV